MAVIMDPMQAASSTRSTVRRSATPYLRDSLTETSSNRQSMAGGRRLQMSEVPAPDLVLAEVVEVGALGGAQDGIGIGLAGAQ
jgi:hypothetical protein